ncbi:MAG: ATP-binding protein [Candidatus Hydrogenedentes bacterium]|nr:ATP-binding protein [Candidatus Hydrogenedentota bacterium]
MNVPFFREEIASTFEAMAGTLDRAVAELLSQDIISREEAPCTRLCLEEALVNAIRHGNKCDAHRRVFLEMTRNGESYVIRVGDEGAGFSPEQVELPDCEQLGGRGICLIRHFMDQVRYNHREHCLEMKFRRKAVCKGD